MKTTAVFKSLLALTLVTGIQARAVIIAGGDGTGNTTGTGVSGWDYVGKISNVGSPSSVTYLGNSWFITANHVKQLDNPTSVVFNASTYSIDPSSWTRITNSTGTGADLIMFRVNGSIGLSNVTVRSAPVSSGASVTMIGNGLDRYPDLYTLSLPGPDEYYYGVKSSSYHKRWGTNTIEGDGGWVSEGYGTTKTFFTDFDYVNGEAQGITYDSGGGVFLGASGAFELAGIMISATNVYTINGTNAVMLAGGNNQYAGSMTYMADLSVYSNQIFQTIPEPTTALLLLSTGFLFGALHRYQRRRGR